VGTADRAAVRVTSESSSADLPAGAAGWQTAAVLSQPAGSAVRRHAGGRLMLGTIGAVTT
jgi:hypothetical protein